MASKRAGETTNLQELLLPPTDALANHGVVSDTNQAAACFFGDRQQGCSYSWELEDAFVHGVLGITVDDGKSFFSSRPPPTPDIFRSGPMRLQLQRSPGRSTDRDGQPLDARTLRRLAQNREAARKSRLRKKAYVQQLESCKMKLTQVEQDLQRTRSQGCLFGGGGGAGGGISPGAAMFDMEYVQWVAEDRRNMTELRAALLAHAQDGDLRATVDGCLAHYDEMFRLRGAAVKSDVFHLLTGLWTSPAERCFFLWMGGFRPSEIIKVLIPLLEPLTGKQFMEMTSLQQSAQQAEEALTKGLDQLRRSLAEAITTGSLINLEEMMYVSSYIGQMALALGKLSNLEALVQQAENLRHQTLHELRRILTIRQTARCFLAMGDYHSRLRALSSLWVSRPQQSLMDGSGCLTIEDLQTIHLPDGFLT